eukprot:scaffold8106_cov107-Isochrysis_galbana.AAC.7
MRLPPVRIQIRPSPGCAALSQQHGVHKTQPLAAPHQPHHRGTSPTCAHVPTSRAQTCQQPQPGRRPAVPSALHSHICRGCTRTEFADGSDHSGVGGVGDIAGGEGSTCCGGHQRWCRGPGQLSRQWDIAEVRAGRERSHPRLTAEQRRSAGRRVELGQVSVEQLLRHGQRDRIRVNTGLSDAGVAIAHRMPPLPSGHGHNIKSRDLCLPSRCAGNHAYPQWRCALRLAGGPQVRALRAIWASANLRDYRVSRLQASLSSTVLEGGTGDERSATVCGGGHDIFAADERLPQPARVSQEQILSTAWPKRDPAQT